MARYIKRNPSAIILQWAFFFTFLLLLRQCFFTLLRITRLHYLKAFNRLSFLIFVNLVQHRSVSAPQPWAVRLTFNWRDVKRVFFWCLRSHARDQKSSVIWFSGRPHNTRNHTSFQHPTHAIHVAFLSCFVYLKTQVHILCLLYRWFNKGILQVQAEELASLSESD